MCREYFQWRKFNCIAKDILLKKYMRKYIIPGYIPCIIPTLYISFFILGGCSSPPTPPPPKSFELPKILVDIIVKFINYGKGTSINEEPFLSSPLKNINVYRDIMFYFNNQNYYTMLWNKCGPIFLEKSCTSSRNVRI